MARVQIRDLDADGTILWVEKSKTEAGKHGVEVAEVFRPFLRAFAQGRGSQGAKGHAVVKALGHTSFAVTRRHDMDREVLENANLRSNL